MIPTCGGAGRGRWPGAGQGRAGQLVSGGGPGLDVICAAEGCPSFFTLFLVGGRASPGEHDRGCSLPAPAALQTPLHAGAPHPGGGDAEQRGAAALVLLKTVHQRLALLVGHLQRGAIGRSCTLTISARPETRRARRAGARGARARQLCRTRGARPARHPTRRAPPARRCARSASLPARAAAARPAPRRGAQRRAACGLRPRRGGAKRRPTRAPPPPLGGPLECTLRPAPPRRSIDFINPSASRVHGASWVRGASRGRLACRAHLHPAARARAPPPPPPWQGQSAGTAPPPGAVPPVPPPAHR